MSFRMYHAQCNASAMPLSKQHQMLVLSMSGHLPLHDQGGGGVSTHLQLAYTMRKQQWLGSSNGPILYFPVMTPGGVYVSGVACRPSLMDLEPGLGPVVEIECISKMVITVSNCIPSFRSMCHMRIAAFSVVLRAQFPSLSSLAALPQTQ